VVGLQRAVVLVFNVFRKLVHQERRLHRQVELHRLQAMAQRLLHPCSLLPKVVHLKECVLQVLVPVDLEVQVPVVLVDQAERRSHRQPYGSSHSWVICSSAVQST
jgi:hypothetical protein